jgi:hypothetical protein
MKMDKESITIIVFGVLFIAMAILGKIRPEIIFRNWTGKVVKPEVQRFGFFMFLLLGVMFVAIPFIVSVPQWQDYKDAITISIAMAVTAALVFLYWVFVLRQNERLRGIGFAIVMLFSIALIALSVYYWYITLK